MTSQEKLLSYVILGISKGLLGEFDEVPDEPASTKTATRLAELTKATEVVVENQLALDNRLARLEDELRALRADLKEYTLVAAMRPPAAAEPTPITAEPTPITEAVTRVTRAEAYVEEIENREQLRDLADLVDCVRVQRGISREQMAQDVGSPMEPLGELMQTDLATLARAAKMLNETGPQRMHAPLAPYPSLSSPPPTPDLSSPPAKVEPTKRTKRSAKGSKPAKQSSKSTKPAKQSSTRSSKKQPKAQATNDEVPVVEPWMSEWADKVAEGMGVPNPSEQTATGETVVRLRAKGGRR